jgi:hypothetical protein
MRTRHFLAATVLALPLTALAEADSPWLPIPGQFTLGFSQTEQSGKSAYIGSTEMPLSAITGGGASKYKRSTTQFRASYGLSDSVSLDAALGFGRVEVGLADRDNGSTDSVLGVNWRVLDEFERPGLPSLTLRGAAILKGSYEGGRLASVGKDANGYELAVILGKQFTPELSLWSELGFQDRTDNVPNATFFELNGRYRFAPRWSATLGYSTKKFGGNLDIGGPGFAPSRFQQVREERELVKLGVGFAFAGNQGVALNLAKVTGGRNSVKDDSTVGVSYTLGF